MSQPGKKMIAVYVDEAIHREIRVYSAETGRTLQDICQPLFEEFQQSAIKMVTQIKEMKRKAELERMRQEEEAKIVSENPLVVEGHQVDPIGQLQIESPITQ
jgi:hypothetical protein